MKENKGEERGGGEERKEGGAHGRTFKRTDGQTDERAHGRMYRPWVSEMDTSILKESPLDSYPS